MQFIPLCVVPLDVAVLLSGVKKGRSAFVSLRLKNMLEKLNRCSFVTKNLRAGMDDE